MSNEPREPIDRAESDPRIGVAPDITMMPLDLSPAVAAGPSSVADWSDLLAWAARLVKMVADDHPSQHVSVFVPDEPVTGLRLAATVRTATAPGANEDASDIAVGEWVVPIEGSLCGRVYRTGTGALVADASLDADARDIPGGGSRSSLTVPVGPAGDVVAVIHVEAPWVGAFSVRDYDRLTERASAAFATVPRRQVA